MTHIKSVYLSNAEKKFRLYLFYNQVAQPFSFVLNFLFHLFYYIFLFIYKFFSGTHKNLRFELILPCFFGLNYLISDILSTEILGLSHLFSKEWDICYYFSIKNKLFP